MLGPLSHLARPILTLARPSAGNLHINIVAKEYNERTESAIEPWIYEAVGASSSLPLPLLSLELS